MRKLIAAVGLFVATMCLALPADPTAALKKADADWAATAQNKDVDKFISFLADDVDMSGPEGKWSHGKEAARAEWSQMLKDPATKLSWSAQSAEVSKDGTMGYTRGTWEATMGGKNMNGTYATVWKKQKDGNWRVVVDMATPQSAQ
jgi:uncharacterized protein (TIGR02246 family)